MKPKDYLKLLTKDVRQFYSQDRLLGTKTFNLGRENEQTAYQYQVYFFDVLRETEIWFMVSFLVQNTDIFKTTIRDEKGRNVEILTDRVVDRYLKAKSDRDLTQTHQYLYKV